MSCRLIWPALAFSMLLASQGCASARPVPATASAPPASASPTPAAAPLATPALILAPAFPRIVDVPPAPAGPTAAQRSQQEALSSGTHPERLGTMMLPTVRFDAARWANDPTYARQWLETHEPGRVFQPAEPGPDVPAISRLGDEDVDVPHGKAVILAVQVRPGDPVTFNAMDSGLMAGSRLACETVVADADGVAQIVFSQAPGTVGLCRILAASPRASGQARFSVTFADPPVTPATTSPTP